MSSLLEGRMPLLLRTIRKARWYPPDDPSWLTPNDIPADPLGDLATKGNALSVWTVLDDKSNLERVVTALAAARDYISNLDYALFDEQLIAQAEIKITKTRGSSPDQEASSSWHRDLTQLSAHKLVELAKLILESSERARIPEKRVAQLLKEAVVSGQVDRSLLKDTLVTRIDRLIQSEPG